MEEAGTVSLWMGNSISRQAFDRALEVAYSEDGDLMGSPFSRAFGIEYYDEGLKEARFFEGSSSKLDELLGGVSHESVIVGRFRDQVPHIASPFPFNSVVLLYDHRHEGPVYWIGDGVSLRFVCSVRYR